MNDELTMILTKHLPEAIILIDDKDEPLREAKQEAFN
jgi:hypothetical protein